VFPQWNGELNPRDVGPVCDGERGGEDTGGPCARQNPRNRVHDGEVEALQCKHELYVEKDGLEAKVVDGVDGGEEQLLVNVEPMEDVDGAQVLG
jgi:hypothetical protein